MGAGILGLDGRARHEVAYLLCDQADKTSDPHCILDQGTSHTIRCALRTRLALFWRGKGVVVVHPLQRKWTQNGP
jgi:hypothetical protein